MTDTEMLDFIEHNQAVISFDDAGPPHRRCRVIVYPRHFSSPDRRERFGLVGFGPTLREAVSATVICRPTFDLAELNRV